MWTTLNERQSRFLRPALQPPNTGLASLMRGLKDLLTRCLSISRNSVFREPRVFLRPLNAREMGLQDIGSSLYISLRILTDVLLLRCMDG